MGMKEYRYKAIPFDQATAFAQATGRQPRRGRPVWVPKLRYVKDKFGIPASHSGDNRGTRRMHKVLTRRSFTDIEGVFHRGQRSKAKLRARESGRPVRYAR